MENNTPIEPVKKKRGRKKKSETVEESANIEPPVPKKRGRKPKGGKIISTPLELNEDNSILSNIILHLKCNLSDIENNNQNSTNLLSNPLSYQPNAPPDIMTYDNTINTHNFANYNTDQVSINDYAYKTIEKNSKHIAKCCEKCNSKLDSSDITNNEDLHISLKDINYKLKEIKLQLYKDSNPDKKSACFWCTYDYDNPSCYIPKFDLDGTTCGYGSFCRPECAAAYLMKENIDDSAKYERYQLLNKIYGKVYNYKKNIKPAPNPYYLLDKFFGNLSIQEFRKLLKSEHMLLVLEKPLTRVLPELHEDSDNSNINNSLNNNTSGYKVKKQSEKQKGPSKVEIMKEKFGF